MKIFLQKLERFPTAFALVFLCAGIYLARQVDGSDIASWSRPALIPALGLLLLALKRGKKVFLGLAASLLFLLLGFHLASNQLWFGRDFEPSSAKHVVHTTVSKMWASGQGFRVFIVESGLDITAGTSLPGNGRLFLRDNTISLCAGDRIAFYSRIRKPINRGNPGEYDWEIDCKSNGIHWLVATQGQDSVLLLQRGSRFRPAAILFQFREAMDHFLETYSGRFLETYLAPFLRNDSVTQVRGFLKGIILGDLGEVDPGLYKSFADSGLIHVLSASGVHVAIVVLLSLIVVRGIIRITPWILLWIPYRKLGALASVPAMIIYCLLVEARVPAIRSTLMGLVIAGAVMSGRKWNSFNSLALAALLVLLLYPLSVFTPSFQLSFAAVAGIFFVVPHLTKVSVPRSSSKYRGTRYRRREKRTYGASEKGRTTICGCRFHFFGRNLGGDPLDFAELPFVSCLHAVCQPSNRLDLNGRPFPGPGRCSPWNGSSQPLSLGLGPRRSMHMAGN